MRFPAGVISLSKKYRTIDYGRFEAAQGSIHYSMMPHHVKDELDIIKLYASEGMIIDATANCGVTSVNVSIGLRRPVVSIELDSDTFKALLNNADEFRKEANISPIHGNSMEVLRGWEGKVDFVLVDAPWGGKGYDKVENLMLFLNDETGKPIPLHEVANFIFQQTRCNHVILKVPRNFDMSTFTHHFNGNYTLHHILKKSLTQKEQFAELIDYNFIVCQCN